jgi:hypothetical protein
MSWGVFFVQRRSLLTLALGEFFFEESFAVSIKRKLGGRVQPDSRGNQARAKAWPGSFALLLIFCGAAVSYAQAWPDVASLTTASVN